MAWEIAAIWAILIAAVAGFIYDEMQRRREARKPGPRISVADLEAERRALGEVARFSRLSAQPIRQPIDRRRSRLRAVGF